ncbi:MAG: hypothetical protein H7836_04715 [Magnetococcus sp. YQC-3]
MNIQKSKSKDLGFNLVFEEFVPSNSGRGLEIIQEMKSEDGGQDRIKFRVPLQDADVVNGNRRIYTKETCNAIIEGLLPQARNRCLLQELD